MGTVDCSARAPTRISAIALFPREATAGMCRESVHLEVRWNAHPSTCSMIEQFEDACGSLDVDANKRVTEGMRPCHKRSRATESTYAVPIKRLGPCVVLHARRLEMFEWRVTHLGRLGGRASLQEQKESDSWL